MYNWFNAQGKKKQVMKHEGRVAQSVWRRAGKNEKREEDLNDDEEEKESGRRQ